MPSTRPALGRRSRAALLVTAAVAGVVAMTPAAASADAGQAVAPSGAITSTWLWDVGVDPAVDPRGTGYAAASPDAVVAFARAHGLREMHVAAPWASDEGAVAPWLTATLTSLRDAGVDAGVLGGDAPWLDDPSLAVRWMQAAIHDRPVTHVQLDVEPWTLPVWQTDQAGTARRWLDLLDHVRAALPPGVGLGLDLPFWLTTVPAPDGHGTLLDAALARADRACVVTFADHADGPDGVLSLSADAVSAARRAGVPFTVGLETDTPEVAGGARFTFYDDGAAALDATASAIAAALDGDSLFRGVSVEHYRAWRALLGLA